MPSREVLYRLPGDPEIRGPVATDWLWREISEGRINAAATVAEALDGLWVPFSALANDAFGDEVLLEAEASAAHRAEAEQLHLQAIFRLNECQAHVSVYGDRPLSVVQEAQNGLEFVDAALKHFPRNPNYLNTKALLLSDGLGLTEAARAAGRGRVHRATRHPDPAELARAAGAALERLLRRDAVVAGRGGRYGRGRRQLGVTRPRWMW